MKASYAVTWQQGAEPVQRGKLELGRVALVLEGSDAAGPQGRRIAYDEMTSVQVARVPSERLSGRQTLLVDDRRSLTSLRIAGVAQPGIISELAENLTVLRTGERRHVTRLVIVVPLQQDARGRAQALLRKGPPFDPDAAGLERHHVFLTDHEAVFVFEADQPDAVERLASDQTLWEAMAGWDDLVAGPPRIAEDIYSWVRPHATEDVSFASTPGPGDSDGGDVYAP
jgi:hypothetical protein